MVITERGAQRLRRITPSGHDTILAGVSILFDTACLDGVGEEARLAGPVYEMLRAFGVTPPF